MKTIICALVMMCLGVGCANKTDNATATNTTTTATSSYQLYNGICYQTSTGQQVADGYCTSTNSGFVSSNGYCFQASTGQQVPTSYCTSTTTNAGQCVGVYIFNGQYVQCAGANCSGYQLIQPSTGTVVYCQ